MKTHVSEVKLHGIAARFRFCGPTEPPWSSTLQGFRELRLEGETGGRDGKRTSDSRVIKLTASAIKWPQANTKRQGALDRRTARY